MKKLLLSIVALVCCMSLNAKDTVLRDSTVTFVDDKPSTKEVYTYDENGYLTGFNRYDRVGNEWVLSLWQVMRRDARGNCVYEEDYQMYNGELWGLTYFERTYDENDNLISGWNAVWMNGQWVNDSKTESKYNDKNALEEQISYRWKNGSWVYNSKQSHHFDADGLETGYTVYSWYDGVWVVTGKYEYEYDEDGHLSTATQYVVNDSTNDPLNKTTYTYKYGYQACIVYYSWVGDSWQPTRKRVYDPNEDGTLNFNESYNYTNGEWVLTSRNEYTIDENVGRTREVSYQYMRGELVAGTRNDYTFDANGNQDGYISYQWNNGDWSPESKYEYVFDENRHLLENYIYYWNGDWYLQYHIILYYTDHANGIDEVVFGAPGAVVRKYVKNGKVVIERAGNSFAVDGRMMK